MDANETETETSADSAKGEAKKPKPPKMVEIVVNTATVVIAKGEHTGLEIKQVAKQQGAVLELDFVLSVERGGHHVTVADDDIVKVHAGMDFLAVAGDDNS